MNEKKQYVNFLRNLGAHKWANQILEWAFEKNYKYNKDDTDIDPISPYNKNVRTFSALRKGYLLMMLADWSEYEETEFAAELLIKKQSIGSGMELIFCDRMIAERIDSWELNAQWVLTEVRGPCPIPDWIQD